MSLKLKYAIEASVFWPPADRVVSSGYKEQISEEDVYKFVKQVEGVDGVEIYYPYDFTDIGKMKKIITNNGLKVSAVGIGNFAEPKWQNGAVTSSDAIIRKEAIDIAKKSIEAASELGAKVLVFWPAHDGYDYYFQTDYQEKWNLLVESLKELSLMNKEILIGIEYKPKEPRTHQIISNASKALQLSEQVMEKNVGVIMDVGHSFLAHENPAEEAVYLMNKNRLFHIHSNDNYNDWDYDLIPGSVHFWEYIELFYWLDKLSFEGWINFDICPFRIDAVRSCNQSIKNTKILVDLAKKINVYNFDKLIKKGDPLSTQEYLWNALFKL